MKKSAAIALLIFLMASLLIGTAAAQEPLTFAPVPAGSIALTRALFGLAQLVFTFVLAIAVVYVGVSFAVAILIALSSLWLFDRLTRENKELEEIRRDNVAVAVFFSGVFLSMAFFMEAGLHGLLVALIPGMNIRLP